MSKSDFPPKVKEQIRQRAGGVCEVCRLQDLTEYHHRLTRSKGGQGTLENGLGLCLHCHAHVHAHPAEAFEHGWLLHAAPVNMGLKS